MNELELKSQLWDLIDNSVNAENLVPIDNVFIKEEYLSKYKDLKNKLNVIQNNEKLEYITGTNILKPRVRHHYESDDDYVRYLEEYYSYYFPKKETKDEPVINNFDYSDDIDLELDDNIEIVTEKSDQNQELDLDEDIQKHNVNQNNSEVDMEEFEDLDLELDDDIEIINNNSKENLDLDLDDDIEIVQVSNPKTNLFQMLANVGFIKKSIEFLSSFLKKEEKVEDEDYDIPLENDMGVDFKIFKNQEFNDLGISGIKAMGNSTEDIDALYDILEKNNGEEYKYNDDEEGILNKVNMMIDSIPQNLAISSIYLKENDTIKEVNEVNSANINNAIIELVNKDFPTFTLARLSGRDVGQMMLQNTFDDSKSL